MKGTMADKKQHTHPDENEEVKQEIDLEVEEGMDEISADDHADCEARLAEVEGKYKRALADYSNLERQTRESQIRFAKLATQGFVEELVEPYDHLKLAAKHLKDKGLEMVMSHFTRVFDSQGLKELNPEGKAFDASQMEAVDTVEGDEGKVIEVVSSGYELNGVVIKPARVIVGTKK